MLLYFTVDDTRLVNIGDSNRSFIETLLKKLGGMLTITKKMSQSNVEKLLHILMTSFSFLLPITENTFDVKVD